MPSENKITPFPSPRNGNKPQVLEFPKRSANARPIRPVCDRICRDLDTRLRGLSATYGERLEVVRAIALDHLRELAAEGKVAA